MTDAKYMNKEAVCGYRPSGVLKHNMNNMLGGENCLFQATCFLLHVMKVRVTILMSGNMRHKRIY